MTRVRRSRFVGSRPRGWLFALGATAASAVLAVVLFSGSFRSSLSVGPLVHVVARSEFLHEIKARGILESASNAAVECEVYSHGNVLGTTILQIVPEGTYVQPGDFLVKLDSSVFEEERIQKQTIFNIGKAALIGAEHDLEIAKLALQVYSDGTFPLAQRTLACDVVETEMQHRQAVQYFENSRKLCRGGFITNLQLEADQIALESAGRELALAKINLKVLEDFTQEKTVTRMENQILTAEAFIRARRRVHERNTKEIAEVEEEIAKCTIHAPEAGQVVYANVHHNGHSHIIEEGARVRLRQDIIWLPDPKRMQVKVTISEACIAKVGTGMTATVMLDSRPGLQLRGTVEKVKDYPEATNHFSSSMKQFETTIRIEDPPPGLRPGLTSDVKICVERASNKVQVPNVAIFEHEGHHYCVLRDGSDWQARQVKIGSMNDKFVVIEENLEPGEEVVLGAAAYRDKIDLPGLSSDESPEPVVASRRPKPAPRATSTAKRTTREPAA